ncbi:hypothetical protein CAPTEDRAFT_130530 [Capitella teleta]|uniref:Transmembrane protein 117 n=1 Tax=Capitella teleta TaxID=283909 RepID=R7UXM1_CAPTE|nr:hypothetical protein CAPTEDRAFT_130530 [Capitella teleta]|eukprot:ELU08141.1 hypothetical protein CAPTEDRAFT_130530 [Capitella teleta]
MTRDFRYYFQHPYARLIFAYLVTFCNFLIYAEDPVAHSEKECFIPVVGNCFSFVATRYPTNAWAFLKVFMWVGAIIIGIVVGKIIVHSLVFNRLFRLKMFNEGQGSWMTMFFTSIMSLFIISWVYNGLLKIGGDSTIQYEITENMGIKNSVFMKAAATGTWCGDFFTAWMVTDIMLQEKLYPHWGHAVRKWWVRNYHRIFLFWIIVVVTSGIVLMVIITDWINWDFLNRDFITSNEFSRGILASFILVMDLLIVMQDWDFPYFVNNFDVKMPGVNTAHFIIRIPQLLNPQSWKIHISGKWFNYGIIFIVMLLDLNMWKNQIFYSPYEYGQYVNPEGRIITVKDRYSLETFNETEINYEWRSTNINPVTNLTYFEGDMMMNSRYVGYSLALKSIAFVPCLLSFLCFGIMVWYFGRWKPTDKDHYAGRLKKRPKRPKRRSLFNRSIASIQNGVDLMRFSKRKAHFDELDVANPDNRAQSQDVQDVPV